MKVIDWIKDWVEFFCDDRFGWRFKIANFIMNDLLRNYLAVGALLPLDSIIEHKNHANVVETEAIKARKSIIDVMEM